MNLPEADPSLSSEERKGISNALGHATKFTGSSSKFLLKFFGCQTCPLKQNGECPHGLKGKEKHSNGICSYRVGQLKELYDQGVTPVGLFQRDNLVKSQLLLDHFRDEFAEKGELHPMFHQLERNLISLTDKIRKQDEGIKMKAEVTIHDDIRKAVRVQLEAIDADFEVKGNNGKAESVFLPKRDA